VAEDHIGHSEDEYGTGEDDADPEAAGHVTQFWIGLIFGGDRAGFEGHSADGAVAGPVADDLGVHGADVFDLRDGLFRLDSFQSHTALGAGAGMVLSQLGMHGAGAR
jgi:hypothetical protein